jgi:hypothetical protein
VILWIILPRVGTQPLLSRISFLLKALSFTKFHLSKNLLWINLCGLILRKGTILSNLGTTCSNIGKKQLVLALLPTIIRATFGKNYGICILSPDIKCFFGESYKQPFLLEVSSTKEVFPAPYCALGVSLKKRPLIIKEETIDHAFMLCQHATKVGFGSKLGINFDQRLTNFPEWLTYAITTHNDEDIIYMAAIIYGLWYARNQKTFEDRDIEGNITIESASASI